MTNFSTQVKPPANSPIPTPKAAVLLHNYMAFSMRRPAPGLDHIGPKAITEPGASIAAFYIEELKTTNPKLLA